VFEDEGEKYADRRPQGLAARRPMNHDDILDQKRPVHDGDEFVKKHPKMPVEQRAKIFMPFDALEGFDESIESRSKVTVHPAVISDDRKEELNRQFAELADAFGKIPRKSRLDGKNALEVSVLYFERDYEQEILKNDGVRGNYRWTAGVLEDIDLTFRQIKISDRIISIDSVYAVKYDLRG
jgi:hypothetical protein